MQSTSGNTVHFGGARKEVISTKTALLVSGVIVAGVLIYALRSKS
jgi:hypothetical protein